MKQHPTYTHLFITKDGRVFSTKSNKFLKTVTNKNGYKVFVTKLNGRKGGDTALRVHRLVAEVYIPNPQNKPFVNHKDCNPANNSVSNLEWVTSKENAIHARDSGRLYVARGELNTQAKLSNKDATKIRELYVPHNRERGARSLARKFQVDKTAIIRIVSGQSY